LAVPEKDDDDDDDDEKAPASSALALNWKWCIMADDILFKKWQMTCMHHWLFNVLCSF
jgi:hypothetical protein